MEHVVAPHSVEHAVLVAELALAVHQAVLPLSLVVRAVDPDHLAVAIPNGLQHPRVPAIVVELALVVGAVDPLVDALATLAVVHILALVHVDLLPDLLVPQPLPVPQSVREVALVHRPRVPDVLPVAVRLPVGVLPLVEVSVLEDLRAVAVLEVLLHLAEVARYRWWSGVHVAVGVEMQPPALDDAVEPLA